MVPALFSGQSQVESMVRRPEALQICIRGEYLSECTKVMDMCNENSTKVSHEVRWKMYGGTHRKVGEKIGRCGHSAGKTANRGRNDGILDVHD